MFFCCWINFSYSCGYRKAFEEYVTIVNERYPQIAIEGANYEPSGINFLLSKLILAAKMIFILVIVSQYDIWGQLGQTVPRWFQWCTENKIYACMMVFFVGNMLEAQVTMRRNLIRLRFIWFVFEIFFQCELCTVKVTPCNWNSLSKLTLLIIHFVYLQLVSSGAFEISLNDIPIWSKLETGRIPSPQELFNIIDSQIKVFADALPSGFDQ